MNTPSVGLEISTWRRKDGCLINAHHAAGVRVMHDCVLLRDTYLRPKENGDERAILIHVKTPNLVRRYPTVLN